MAGKTKKAMVEELLALSRDAYGLSLDEFRTRAEEISRFDLKTPGPSVLMQVASNVQPEKVRVLLELGVRPDANVICTAAGGTSGGQAAALEVFELLVDLVDDLNVSNRWGSTPLIDATDTNCWSPGIRLRVVERLLKGGADPNRGTKQGATRLHFAVCSRSIEVVRLLVDAGADRHAAATGRSRNVVVKGDTPVSLAEQLVEYTDDPRAERMLELLTTPPTGPGQDATSGAKG